MIFSSLTFLFAYLPVTLAVYFLTPLRWRNWVLLAVSLFFYGWGEPVYILIMFLSILIDYTHGMLVEKYRSDDRKARWFVAQSVIFNLLLLGFFKYWDFLAANLSLIPGVRVPQLGIPLPIGISFFTFQTMSYTIDVYRQDAPVQRNMVKFGTFVTMFPQLIAGPIVQYKTVAAALEHRVNTTEDFARGAGRFTVGLAKKVLLANSIGALWEECLAAQAAGTLTAVSGWTSPDIPIWPSVWDTCSASGSTRTFGIHIWRPRCRSSGGAGTCRLPAGSGTISIFPWAATATVQRRPCAISSWCGSAQASGTGPAGTSCSGGCTSSSGSCWSGICCGASWIGCPLW